MNYGGFLDFLPVIAAVNQCFVIAVCKNISKAKLLISN